MHHTNLDNLLKTKISAATEISGVSPALQVTSERGSQHLKRCDPITSSISRYYKLFD